MMYLCLRCNGTGEHEQARDLHRSGGTVPCSDCSGAGKLDERMYQFLKRLGYRVSEEPLSTRSQAEELLSGRDAVIEMQADSIDKLERKVQHWQERADQAVELLAAERAEHERTDELLLSAVNDCHTKDCQIKELQADNAALAARINGFEGLMDSLCEILKCERDIGDVVGALEALNGRAEAIEVRLAAAEKALEPFGVFGDETISPERRHFLQLLICPEGDEHPENYGPHFRKARAALGGKPS